MFEVNFVSGVVGPVCAVSVGGAFVLSIVQVILNRELVKLKISPRVCRDDAPPDAVKLAVEASATLP